MIDWQSYHDGLMPESERRALAIRLEQDEELRREYAGFVAFIGATREAAREATPGYESTFASLGRRSRLRPTTLAFAGGLAIGLIAFVGWRLSLDPLTLATTRTQATISVQTPSSAASWVRSHSTFEPPIIDLGNGSRIVGARYGQGWACYDYEQNGQPLYLYMSRTDNFEQAPKVGRDGQTFFVGRGIGWRARGMSFYLKGGEEASRWVLASNASRQTASL